MNKKQKHQSKTSKQSKYSTRWQIIFALIVILQQYNIQFIFLTKNKQNQKLQMPSPFSVFWFRPVQSWIIDKAD